MAMTFSSEMDGTISQKHDTKQSYIYLWQISQTPKKPSTLHHLLVMFSQNENDKQTKNERRPSKDADKQLQ